MMLQMLGVFAEFEHATIVDRVTSGIERRAKEGRWPNGRIPFGYTLNDGQLAPDPITAPVVRRIFKLVHRRPARRRRHRPAARRRARARAAAPAGATRPCTAILANATYVGRIHWRDQDFRIHARAADRPRHLRPRAGDPRRARRGWVPPPRQPLGLPALRRVALRTLRTRLHRHVSTRQRRHLPLLRLHRPPEVRPQSLPRRARPTREARDRRPRQLTDIYRDGPSSATPSPPPHEQHNASDPRSKSDAAPSTPRSPAPNARSSATSRPSSRAGSPPSAANSAYRA